MFDSDVTYDTYPSFKNSLYVSNLIDNKYWVVAWSDNRFGRIEYGSDNMVATRLNIDGTVGDPESGIHTIQPTDSPADSPIYDLTGRRVTHPVKGVYIQNGKKTVMR